MRRNHPKGCSGIFRDIFQLLVSPQMTLRRSDTQFSGTRHKVINNFSLQFGKILANANVQKLSFHDFQNTALSNWFAQGMKEYEIIRLAGHLSFSTMHKFYLVAAGELVDCAREATAKDSV
jgi:hypothetical protein